MMMMIVTTTCATDLIWLMRIFVARTIYTHTPIQSRECVIKWNLSTNRSDKMIILNVMILEYIHKILHINRQFLIKNIWLNCFSVRAIDISTFNMLCLMCTGRINICRYHIKSESVLRMNTFWISNAFEWRCDALKLRAAWCTRWHAVANAVNFIAINLNRFNLITMRSRCSHFDRCFFFAKRKLHHQNANNTINLESGWLASPANTSLYSLCSWWCGIIVVLDFGSLWPNRVFIRFSHTQIQRNDLNSMKSFCFWLI